MSYYELELITHNYSRQAESSTTLQIWGISPETAEMAVSISKKFLGRRGNVNASIDELLEFHSEQQRNEGINIGQNLQTRYDPIKDENHGPLPEKMYKDFCTRLRAKLRS